MFSSQRQNSDEPSGLLRTLVVAFSGVLFGLFLSKLRTPNNKSKESVSPHDTPYEESRNRQLEPAVVSQVPPAPPKQDQSNWRKEDAPAWEKWAAISIAAGTIGLLVVNFCQMRSTEKAAVAAKSAANTARNALAASSRAWIAPSNAYFMSKIAKHVPLTWEVQYRNTGNSPALDVHPIWNLQQVPVSKFDDNTFNNFIETDKASDDCKQLGIAPGADAVYPGQPDGYKLLFANHLPEWVNNGVVSGKIALVLQMCFAYKTIEEVHHTSFCYFYRVGVSPPNNQMNICTAGNHAD